MEFKFTRIRTIQSGALGCSKGFVKCFLRTAHADHCLLGAAAVSAQHSSKHLEQPDAPDCMYRVRLFQN